MALKMIEIHKESRKFEVTRRSISKDFVFVVDDEEFLELAEEQEVADADLTLVLDDDVMQRRVLPYFISIIPVNYQFFLDENVYVFLYAASVRAEQLSWRQWKLYVTFDIPDDNGQSQGGGGGESGPADGEANSEEFTQFSFNCTAVFEKRQMGYLLEAQKAIRLLPLLPSLVPGQLQPIGETDNAIEGADQPIRSFTFEITQYMPPSKLTYKYKRRISRLVTAINLDNFFGNAPGSVMCVGANASGHLYQNVPVSLQFEIRPNFRIQGFGGVHSKAALEDIYTLDGNGKKIVNTLTQFDSYVENEFLPTEVIHANHPNCGGEPTLPLPNGVHSGWAHIAYRYDKVINVAAKGVPRLPSERYIYMPEETIYMNFSEFLL